MTTITRHHPYTARHNTHPSPGPRILRPDAHEPDSGWKGTRLSAARPDAPVDARRGQLFVDLTSPWAYLAHRRLERQGRDVSWAAVQRDTTVPRTGLRRDGPERERLRAELAAVRAQASEDEDLPDGIPAVLPHPRTVAAAYAEAHDLGVGPAVRELLLRAYWVEGQDIGDPEVLRRILPEVVVGESTLCTGDPRREFGYLVSPAREPLTNEAYHQLERWQQRWTDLGRPGPVALVEGTSTRTGPAALAG